jgi:hypothetical protein
MIDLTRDLPSNSVYERTFLNLLFAVFWRNNGILWLFLKPCAVIRNFVQPDKTIFPKRVNPGLYWAPFISGYLHSGMPINATNTTSELR